ncbi:pRL2-11 [Streptomyces venezuelae]|uniref:pRL2-11 n=1 Tax=Streptomyces venezuelae TaxID=54571 RepID=UPI00342D8EE7
MAQSAFDKQLEESVEAALQVVGRFLSGREMDGITRTDATFLKAGTWPLDDVKGRIPRSSYRPGWQRAGGRVLSLSALAGGGWSYWQDPEQTLHALEMGGAGLGGALVVGGVVQAIRGRGMREHLREWVQPLHEALAHPLGIPPTARPTSYLHIPKNFNDDDAQIKIDLPVALRFDEAKVAEMIVKKLALQGVSFSWKYDGRKPYVTVKKVNKPPTKVIFADHKVRALVTKAPESAPLIGLERGDRVVSVDLDSESPHVLVSAGTGGGKSVILRTIASQLIHNGAHGYILDFKRVSHNWARGVPNVKYCRDIADIHDALVTLGAEGQRRIHAAEQLPDDADPSLVGPRCVILLEEINATMKQLNRHWEKIKEKGDPKISPAVDALAEILFMGRAVRMHVLLVAQSATARALGGPEMRENFATRILARYTQNAWRMLVPEVQPAPKSTRHIGRSQVVLGGIAHETQVMFMTDAEARAWAIGGARQAAPVVTLHKAESPAESQGHRVTAHPVHLGKQGVDGTDILHKTDLSENSAPSCDTASAPSVPLLQTGAEPLGETAADPAVDGAHRAVEQDAEPGQEAGGKAAAGDGPGQLLTLREAQEELFSHLTVEALRRARANDMEFPSHARKKGTTMLYRRDDLVKWERNRPSYISPNATDIEDEDDC